MRRASFPGLFALPAGLGNVLVGVLAPVVAIAYRRGPRENTNLVSVWTYLGLPISSSR
jgi:hypothetical protein